MKMPDVQPFRRPTWSAVPFDGCRNVESRALFLRPGLALAMLRFGPDGTIHEHPAPFDIDVVCLEGRGKTSIDGHTAELEEGQWVRWPANESHRLWTEQDAMITLMVEHVPEEES